jgi:hypothetical protein
VISWRRIWSFLTILLSLSLATRATLAAPNDAAAAKLREAAIYQDYLATDFAAAEQKLTQALALCQAATDCSPPTRARLHCDLGVVDWASKKADEARLHFASALKEDPSVTVDADLTTPEIQKEFDAAKAAANPATKPPPASDAGATPAAEAAGPSEEASPEPAASQAAPAPTQPKTSSDCPPGFPGCKSEPTSCSTDDDCAAGEKCSDGKCVSEDSEDQTPKLNWVTLAFQADMLVLPSGENVCSGGEGYSCFNADGSWYADNPMLIKGANGAQTGGGQIASSGLALGTMRVLAGFDRVLGNFSIGGALGVAFPGGPKSGRPGAQGFVPIHVEARGRYWFGRNPMGHRSAFGVYAALGAGIGEVDASITTSVNDPSKNGETKTAWRKTGTGFGSAGLGAAMSFGSFAVGLEPRLLLMFPTSGVAVAGQLWAGYGF